MRTLALTCLAGLAGLALACSEPKKEASAPTQEPAAAPEAPAAPAGPDAAALRQRASGIFGTLPDEATSDANPVTDAKIALGRALYFDPRLSKSQEISCNSCHDLARHGVDGEPTSPGHKGQRGDRNSPTVYNAALHVAQFWDGRAADVEAQAKGPVLNPVEMAMPSEEAVVAVLRSIPGYPPMFAAAFPGEADPVTHDNMARAIGAFERRLLTPSRFDAFLEDQDGALTPEELAGLQVFLDAGCTSCHTGPAIGGAMFQKLGAVKPYPTKDPGRAKVTGNPADEGVFKVPSLRNVATTGPWFHDGSLTRLDEVVVIMARHQLGRELDADQVASLVAFLGSLTGSVDPQYIAKPEIPPSGPDTPKPDPT
jgi:cytochrome c peroxidase